MHIRVDGGHVHVHVHDHDHDNDTDYDNTPVGRNNHNVRYNIHTPVCNFLAPSKHLSIYTRHETFPNIRESNKRRHKEDKPNSLASIHNYELSDPIPNVLQSTHNQEQELQSPEFQWSELH